MKKTISLPIFVGSLFLLFFNSCKQASHDEASMPATTKVLALNENPSVIDLGKAKDSTIASSEAIQQYIIRSGDMSMISDDLNGSVALIKKLTKEAGGYITNESLNANSKISVAVMNLNIPVAKFEDFVMNLEKQDMTITGKNIKADDVTEEYIDLKTRLKNRKQLEQKYVSELKVANGNDNIYDLENKLNTIRTEIESAEGRMQYIEHFISYSTLQVEINSNINTLNRWGIRFSNAFRSGYEGLMSVLVVLVYLWPLWLAIISILLLNKNRKWFAFLRKNKKELPTP